ncbi:nuclear pore complex protein Nup93 [Neocloeon triangulifer]|uniref:nuclear pore complex protein Nup93 n=1 Tax=Neocloeon triangulifer TaxID=2078957 RepID=UPI00286EE8CE|nr:nuclear pore complex protein Nup93 [Neocloeon triangulifer]
MADPDLHQLMLDAEQQSAEISSMGSALPQLDRNLRQVCEASQTLWNKLSQSGSSEGIQAHLLLGTKGMDLSQISQKLEALSSKDMLAPLEPVPDTDIDNFLMNETQNVLLGILEETQNFNFGKLKEKARVETEEKVLEESWLKERADILHAILQESVDQEMEFVQPDLETTVMSERPTTVRSLMTSQEVSYASKIIEYNKSILSGSSKEPLMKTFTKMSSQFSEKKILDLWECLSMMVKIPVELSIVDSDPLKSRNSPIVQSALIKQARLFLQDRYKQFMQSAVANNLQRAMRGGAPGTFPLVRSFAAIQEIVNEVGFEDGQIEGLPVWALIFYCLRSGDYKAAYYCVQQAGSHLVDYVAYFEELAASDGQVSESTSEVLRYQYRHSVASSGDSFKKAVFCLLGGCDVKEDFPEVIQTAEDYIWFKLGQVKAMPGGQELPMDMLTFNHLQSLISQEYGETHYKATEQPFLYASMLLLTGQFEEAIEFLNRTTLLRPHAVHMALALAETGLLATSVPLQAPLVSFDENEPAPSKRLNLPRLVMTYCSKFNHSNLVEAINYFYFLRDLKDADGVNLFKLCCCDLALENKAFVVMFGQLNDRGDRVFGVVDEFFSSPEETKSIIRMVAEESEKKSCLEDAIFLFELCNDHENSLRLLNSMLGQVLAQENVPGSVRDRMEGVAVIHRQRYHGKEINCSAPTASNFNLLCHLLEFFNFYHSKDHRKALEIVSELELLPKKQSEVENYTAVFRQLSGDIMKNIPEVMLATMTIISNEFAKFKTNQVASPNRSQVQEELKQYAQAITAYSASLPYNMPGDTNAKMVQLMMTMN